MARRRSPAKRPAVRAVRSGRRAGVRKAGVVTAGVAAGLGVGVGAAVAAQRAFLRRERRRPDPYRHVAYGSVRGTPVGPVESTDGTQLHVEEAGSGPVTLVLSHGFSLNLSIWHHQIEELTSDARLVMYDQRGHGRSGRPASDGWSMEALAADLEAVVRSTTRGEPVVIAGHSMGGMALLEFCELFPELLAERVQGLILIDTAAADVMAGFFNVGRRVQAGFQAVQAALMRALAGSSDRLDVLRSKNSDIAYLSTRVMAFGDEPSPTQVKFVERMLDEVPTEVWISLLPSLLGLDVQETLPNIKVPTLVIAGTKDRLTPLDSAKRIAEAIPDSELLVLDGAGHTPMLERRTEFNAAVRRFLRRIASDAGS